MRETPWGMVWAFGDGKMYTVSFNSCWSSTFSYLTGVRALSSEYTPSELRVYITGDGADVYEDSFLKVARRTEDENFTPTLILVGIRLGIDRVTPAYWEALKESLKLPQSIGIAG